MPGRQGAWDSITVYPNQLQPGRFYEIKVGLKCGGLFQGVKSYVGQVAYDLIGLRWERDGAWQNSPFPAGGLGVLNTGYPFTYLLPYYTYLYWEVPTSGYYAHAVAIDTGVFNTESVPVQPDVSVPYQLRSLISCILDPDSGDSTELFTGYVVYSLPDHPVLGPVVVQETYSCSKTPTKITLLRLLPGSDPVEGGKNFTLSDFSVPVNSVTYQTQTQTLNDGSTVTRSVPVYNLGPSATHDIVIRTQSVVDCFPQGPKTYYCGSYGRFREGAWQ